jgi:hypothetical protein
VTESECAKGDKERETDDPLQEGMTPTGLRSPNSCALGGLANGVSLYVDRQWLAVLPAPEFIRQLLADRWSRSISWQRTDVHEQFCASVRRGDEPKAAIVLP